MSLLVEGARRFLDSFKSNKKWKCDQVDVHCRLLDKKRSDFFKKNHNHFRDAGEDIII